MGDELAGSGELGGGRLAALALLEDLVAGGSRVRDLLFFGFGDRRFLFVLCVAVLEVPFDEDVLLLELFVLLLVRPDVDEGPASNVEYTVEFFNGLDPQGVS